jgi:hypothetical protein
VPAGTVLTPRSGTIVLNRNGQVLESVSQIGCIECDSGQCDRQEPPHPRLLGCYWRIRTDGGNNRLVKDAEVDGFGMHGSAFGAAGHDGSVMRLPATRMVSDVAFSVDNPGGALIQNFWGWGLGANSTSHNQTFLGKGSTKGITLRNNRLENAASRRIDLVVPAISRLSRTSSLTITCSTAATSASTATMI